MALVQKEAAGRAAAGNNRITWTSCAAVRGRAGSDRTNAASAAPAASYMSLHLKEQKAFIDEALTV